MVRLWRCGEGSEGAQAWSSPPVAPAPPGVLQQLPTRLLLAVNRTYSGVSFAPPLMAAVPSAALPPGAAGANVSTFALSSAGVLTPAGGGGCVGALDGNPFHGGALGLGTPPSCGSDGAFAWRYNATDATLRLGAADDDGAPLCLDYGSTAPCPPEATYCNAAASPAERAADLAARLSPAEAASMLSAPLIVENYYGSSPGLPARGLPGLWYGECLHGAVAVCGPAYVDPSTGFVSSGCPTSFPSGLAMGGSLNRTAWAAAGDAVGTEARALFNLGLHGPACWAPNVNAFRDPRWGRGHEVPGEDAACVGAEYAAAYAGALQAEGQAPVLRVLATGKHVYGYDVENSSLVHATRNTFDARITGPDAAEYFLPAFRAAAQRARVRSFMASYNAVNGTPSCANGAILNELLRGEWGWRGFVVSDCGAVANVMDAHGYAPTPATTVAAVLAGGLDAECGDWIARYAAGGVANGTVPASALRAAAANVLEPWFETGWADANASSSAAYAGLGAADIDTPAHRQLALEIAMQGATLLKNDPAPASPNGAGTPLLPLPRGGGRLQRVAVVGPHFNSTTALLGNYSPHNAQVGNQSVLLAMQRRGAAEGFAVSAAPGCAGVECAGTDGFPAAVAAVRGADVAIAVLGLCSDACPGSNDAWTREGEGHDRTSLALPGQQEALLQALVATGVPVVVVLIHGGPLAIEWTAAHMPAILTAFYPGEMGGDAVVGLLFGDAAPSGRSLYTWYPAGFPAQRNLTDMVLPPHAGPGGQSVPGVTYRWYNGSALWPFGWGLSYTSFTFAWAYSGGGVAEVHAAAWAAGEASPPPWAVNVTNTGTSPGAVSALAFVSSGSPGDPLTELFDFQRTPTLQPGESVTLLFNTPLRIVAKGGEPEPAAGATGGQERLPTLRLVPGAYAVSIGDVDGGPNGAVRGRLVVRGDAGVRVPL